MTTMREIIAAAMRKPGVLASGETFSSDEGQDLLMVAQSVILEHPGLSACTWRNVFAASDATIIACDGDRIDCGAFSPTITLPTRQGYAGSQRAMPPLSRVKIIGGATPGLWLYADGWRRADALTLDSENPFGPETDLGLTCQIAFRMAGDFGETPDAVTIASAMRSEKTIRARLYRRPRLRCQDDYGLPQYPFDPFPE